MKENSWDTYTYISLIITCIMLAICVFIFDRFSLVKLIPTCFLLDNFGIFCPGCGCTRAFISLLNFNILQSIYYNPTVIYFAIIVSLYIITQTVDRIFKRKKFLMTYSNIYIYIGIFIMIFNCIIKNILLFF